MSHIRAKALLSVAIAAFAYGAPASAAVQDPGLRLAPTARMTDTVPLSLVGQGLDVARLDWRTPEQRFEVELPPSDWVDQVSLTLYADPVVADATRRSGRDIEVILNGGDPVRLKLQRKGFTARLDLPVKDVRPGKNQVTLRLLPAHGVGCLQAGDGGWDIFLDRSRLDTVVQAKSRSVLLNEVNAMLARPSQGPRRIGIQAYGSDKTALEALMAQGTALRTPEVPRFALGGTGELKIIAGTRLALGGVVTDAAILEASGPRIAVHEGRPVRLILTGDTEAEVRDAVEAYATHKLPDARRRIANPTSLRFAGLLDDGRAELKRRARISDLGGLAFSQNWGAGPDQVSFDVEDPAGSKARVKLDLERAKFVSADSTVDVELNGRSLGKAVLDAERMTLDYVVPQGWLVGQGNILRVTPDLTPADEGCAPSVAASGLMVRPKSRIDLSVVAESAPSDLSRFSAGGSLLTAAKGKGTHIVLPEARAAREDALRILGRIARADGAGLTAASYGYESVTNADILSIGKLPKSVEAPRSVDVALAASERGSVVSLFPEGERWVGVVSPTRAGSIGATANALTGESWGDLSGGISRIREGRVEMAQLAFDGPERGFATDLPNLALPNLDVPAIDMPEVTKAVELSGNKVLGGWKQIELKTPDIGALGGSKLTLRGRYDAPGTTRTLAQRTLADMGDVQVAGFDFKRFNAKSERKAAQIRRQLGLKKVEPDMTWKWGDRHLSFAAMLVFLAFGWACWFLSTAEWRNR